MNKLAACAISVSAFCAVACTAMWFGWPWVVAASLMLALIVLVG